MKIPKLLTFLVAIVVMGLFQEVHAQKGLHVSGGSAEGNGSLSYSIGQLVYSAFTGSNGSLVQGVQQPYEITIVGIVEEKPSIHVQAYPNPTNDQLILNISGPYKVQNLDYELFNSQGSLMENKIITNNHLIISMAKFVPATYFLKINTKNNKQLSKLTFKIIKN